MYTFKIDEARLKTIVTGLDSSVKIIGTQLANGNSLLVLKNLLPELLKISMEVELMDKMIDEAKAQENNSGRIGKEYDKNNPTLEGEAAEKITVNIDDKSFKRELNRGNIHHE